MVCAHCGADVSRCIGSLRVTSFKASVCLPSGDLIIDIGDAEFCDSMCLENEIRELVWMHEHAVAVQPE